MRICLNRGTAGGGLPLEQFLQIAADGGFDGADVELGYAETHGVAALRDLYASKNLTPGGWGPAVDWRNDAAKLEATLPRHALHARLARELGIDSCATWIMPSSELPFAENWKFHVDRLTPAARALADNGLRLGLEFVAPYHLRRKFSHEFIFTPGLMLELADAIGPNVGLLVDSFHLHCAGEPAERLRKIPAGKIVLAHVNDAPNVAVHQVQDGQRLLPGLGAIDVGRFLEELAGTGYAGPVSLEVFNADLRALDPAAAAKRAGESIQKFRGQGQ